MNVIGINNPKNPKDNIFSSDEMRSKKTRYANEGKGCKKIFRDSNLEVEILRMGSSFLI